MQRQCLCRGHRHRTIHCTVFTPDVDDPDAEIWCDGNGRPVRTPAEYQQAWDELKASADESEDSEDTSTSEENQVARGEFVKRSAGADPAASADSPSGPDSPTKACSYVYKHSSSTKPGGVYRARVGVIYQLRRSWKVERVTDGALLDGGDVVEERYVRVTWDDFTARVGEVQGVN
jgi:hypothetical protein